MVWELTNEDKAWVAGIFEGEGSICVYKGAGQKTKYVRILFYNNDLTMLEEIQRMIGGNLHIHPFKRKEEWGESHQLQIGKRDKIIQFKENIFPYMRTKYKKDQFNDALSLANENGGDY